MLLPRAKQRLLLVTDRPTTVAICTAIRLLRKNVHHVVWDQVREHTFPHFGY